MKQEKWMNKEIVIALTILTGFVFIVSLVVYYVSDLFNKGMACGCVIPVPVLMLLLASLGLFVGFLSYFILSQRYVYIRKKDKINAECTLQFLDKDEREIVRVLILEKKALKQSELDELTGFSRVKVFRALKKLEDKGVINKKETGRTFEISLKEPFEKVFFC